MAVIVAVLFTILMFRIFNLQIVNEEYYLNNYIQKAEKEIQTSGTRGLIYDRNGILLADNKLAYSIEMEDVLNSSELKSDKLNAIIDKTVKIIEGHGDSIINEFSIILNANSEYEYSVSSENEKLRFLRDIYGKKTIEELDSDKETLSTSTAAEVMHYLCGEERFNIGNEYDVYQKLYIAMIRYNLSLNSYQKYISTKIASNVCEKTVVAIYENQVELSGISVKEESIRVYDDNYNTSLAHILGYTGNISESQLAKYNAEGKDYLKSDTVGKSGIEEVMEFDLQGTKGVSKIFTDSTGRILEQEDKSDAKAGNNVYLSIDAKLQKAGYTILEQKLAGIVYNKLKNEHVTVTEDMKVIPISIYDVYFQMINNNVLDLTHFSEDDATENERNIYNKFQNKQQNVIAAVREELVATNPMALSQLSEEYNTYLTHIYGKLLDTEGILDKKSIDKEDTTYIAWEKETISLQQFLYYAISKNWINTSKLYEEEETKYSDSDEIYQKLITHIYDGLVNDTGFSKKIYSYLVDNGTVSGNEICMALFDQGVLEYKEESYQSLKNGGSSFEFMKEQIKNLKITPAQIALDPCSGSLVVTDVSTGDVLAMVTYPSYDNNMLSGSVDAVYWSQLNNDLSLPLYNRATQTRTAPGSTFKMVSAITGLEEGAIYPTEQINDLGAFTKVDPTLAPKCWKYPGSHGPINVSQALSESCNYFFYEVGYRLSLDNGKYNNEVGLQKIRKYADLLGITSESGVEIEENEPLFSKTDAVRSAIGQGSNSYSNVQLARYVTTLANRGNNYQLTLLEKVTDASNKLITQFEPKLINKVELSDSTWNAVFTGMRSVITVGTARGTFSGFSIEVAGKSGTAQENKLRSNHSVFVAFAPYSNPEIGVSVVLPNGESSGYNAEVVREMIKYYYNLTTDDELYSAGASIPNSGITND